MGNSYAPTAMAILLGSALVQEGILSELPSLAECWGEPSEADVNLAEAVMGGKLESLGDADWQLEAVKQLVRNASFAGSDIRIPHGGSVAPYAWPRRSINIECWKWHVVLSFPYTEQHINLLEMKSVLSAFNWRFRKVTELHKRIVHLSDSQVAIAVLVKGRTSARTLQAVVSRFNALMLATSSYAFFAYVSTSANPADAPSRWFPKRG